MNDLVAKRYVKALIDGRNSQVVNNISVNLNKISSAFSDEKFISIISSPEVADYAKVDLIISLVDLADETLKNFIKLLGEKRRLSLLPLIANELNVSDKAIEKLCKKLEVQKPPRGYWAKQRVMDIDRFQLEADDDCIKLII
jgi:F0F1-type ATP synthase delta subunit